MRFRFLAKWEIPVLAIWAKVAGLGEPSLDPSLSSKELPAGEPRGLELRVSRSLKVREMSVSETKSELLDHPPLRESEEIFDRDELLNRCLGNLEFAERILDRFSTDFTQKLTDLRQLADAGEVDGMLRLTHQMKGTAANIAAHRLRACLATLEDSMEAEGMDVVESLLECLEVEFNGFQQMRVVADAARPSPQEIESKGATHE